jgi:aminopeptidase
VAFAFPIAYAGHELEGVRLRFEDGRVVQAEARLGEPRLRAMLATDAGAGILGEVAFGLNPGVDRPTRHPGLDEKIGGTMHLALGRGFPKAGGVNVSALHTDLVIDTRAGAEVFADGVPIFRDGHFLDGDAA